MTNWTRSGAALLTLGLLAGCTSAGPNLSGGGGGIAPLTPAPTGQVYSNRLPPPPPPPAAPVTQTPAPTTDTAAATPAPGAASAPVQTASASPVTRESLVGAWRVSSGGGNCQIFMALTQWTGGYRAASRGCPGQVADVSAWDVSGSQVVLKDSGGSTVATLSNAGGTRYEGTTAGGQQVSLYR